MDCTKRQPGRHQAHCCRGPSFPYCHCSLLKSPSILFPCVLIVALTHSLIHPFATLAINCICWLLPLPPPFVYQLHFQFEICFLHLFSPNLWCLSFSLVLLPLRSFAPTFFFFAPNSIYNPLFRSLSHSAELILFRPNGCVQLETAHANIWCVQSPSPFLPPSLSFLWL